jgi:two-component system sensor histidine kinase BaeS
VIGVVWLVIDYLAADYFMDLMKHYQISPTEIHHMFLDSVHQYLLLASVVALVLAGVVSYLLTQWMLRPLHQMSQTIQRMSEGDRAARAATSSGDELGDLAHAFNQMADHLEQIEHLRQNMVIDVAHELRTPLTNVRGYIEGLRDQVVAADEATLSVLEKEVMRLVVLVEDLLTLARADAAELDLRRQPMDLHELIRDVVHQFEPQLRARGLRLELAFPDGSDPLAVKADRQKLAAVIRNVLANAVRYSRDGTTVSIETAKQPDGLLTSITNHGDPIDAGDLPYIFERFYRGEKSRSRDSGGAGIGLAIVKRLIEAHGGTVGARSSAVDGTTIWFTLPAFT